MSETERRIKQIVPPTGDWFQIQMEHLGDNKDRVVMSRITAWAIIAYEPSPSGMLDSVQGIDSDGYGQDDDHFSYFYVHGDDLAPNGKTWLTVFNETPSFNWGLKDISDLERPKF